jgi:hypothetical protein
MMKAEKEGLGRKFESSLTEFNEPKCRTCLKLESGTWLLAALGFRIDNYTNTELDR